MKKQVIFIMTDTQGADMVGCYGNKDMITPNIDELAHKGMKFEKAYTTQPVCGPARSAIFTGQFPHSLGTWSNCVAMPENVRTIGKRLQDSGIMTAYIGKWHLDGGDYFGYGDCPVGWDKKYWYDMRNYLEELTIEDRVRSRNEKTNEEGVSEEFTYAHRCSERAVSFLKDNAENDFFLTISYDEPHHPFICPKEYIDMYRDYELKLNEKIGDKLVGKPEHQKIWSEKTDKTDIDLKEFNYLFSCNSFVDYEIGRVLAMVERYASNATVIYTSDHGDFKHSHSLTLKGPAMYDDITKIPLIIKSKNIEENSVYQYPVSHIDLAPTILELFDVQKPEIYEGKSLCKCFNDRNIKINEEVFIEFGRYEIDHDGFGGFQPIRAVCDGSYKLVINLLTTDELYDLKKDKDEMCNLINNDAYMQIRNLLHDKILDFMNNTRDPFRGYYWERRPWRLDAKKPTWDYTNMTRQRSDVKYEKRQLDYANGLELKELVRAKS